MIRNQTSWMSLCAAACLVVLASLGTSLGVSARQASEPTDPVPNQSCGTSSNQNAANAITGTAKSCFGGSSACWFAEIDAKRDLEAKLGRASGVVCKICPDGVQCSRSATMGNGTYSLTCTTYTENGAQCCKCTASYTGAYTVACAACPVISSDTGVGQD